MSDRVTITWTPEKRDRLLNAYTDHLDKMVADPSLPDSFTFEGHVLVVGYAKYLLEYLDSQFAARQPVQPQGRGKAGKGRNRAN